MEDRTADSTIVDFLDALASGNSTPGGGGAAALTGSEAAALLSMVVNFTVGKKKYAAVEEAFQGYLQRTETLRKELLALADDDVVAFNGVAACYGMPKSTPEEKAARTAAMQSALKGAAKVPMTVAEKCLDLLALVEPIGGQGNNNVVSDAGVAMYLGFAALQSALINVNINLKWIKDEAFIAEYAARRDDVLAAAQSAYAAGKAACESTLEIPL
jgi:formiminotetrahydrofolate cyclodeaminase